MNYSTPSIEEFYGIEEEYRIGAALAAVDGRCALKNRPPANEARVLAPAHPERYYAAVGKLSLIAVSMRTRAVRVTGIPMRLPRALDQSDATDFLTLPPKLRGKRVHMMLFQDCPLFPYNLWFGWEIASPSFHRQEPIDLTRTSCAIKYTLAGRGQVTIGKESFTVKPGEAFLVDSSVPCDYYPLTTDTPWEFITLLLYQGEVVNHFRYIREKKGAKLVIPPQHQVLHLLTELFWLAWNKRYYNPFTVSEMVYRLSLLLHQFTHTVAMTTPHPVIEQAVSYIEHHYAEEMRVEEVAQKSQVSASHLYALFRTYLDMTPVQYITETRLAYARDYLRSSDLSVAHIAERCGFESTAYFCRIFRKANGLTPTGYRRQQLAQVEKKL